MYTKAPRVHPPVRGDFHTLGTEEAYLQLPPRPFLQGYAAVGADHPVPGEAMFFGKGMEDPHRLAGTIGKARPKGNITVRGNLAFWNCEDLFRNPAGGVGHCA